MAGGPVFHLAPGFFGANGHVYPLPYEGAGSTNDTTPMLGVTDATTLTADVGFHLIFPMPVSLPSGTAKLRLWSRANATTGALKVNPKWVSVAATEDPSSATLNAEGTSTITWSTGDADDYKETKITLDADTIVAGENVHMDLTFEDTSTTLAVESGHLAAIIWE